MELNPLILPLLNAIKRSGCPRTLRLRNNAPWGEREEVDNRPRVPSGCSTCWLLMAVNISYSLVQLRNRRSGHYLAYLEHGLHFILPVTVVQGRDATAVPLIIAGCLEGSSTFVHLGRKGLRKTRQGIFGETAPTRHTVTPFHLLSWCTTCIVTPLRSTA